MCSCSPDLIVHGQLRTPWWHVYGTCLALDKSERYKPQGDCTRNSWWMCRMNTHNRDAAVRAREIGIKWKQIQGEEWRQAISISAFNSSDRWFSSRCNRIDEYGCNESICFFSFILMEKGSGGQDNLRQFRRNYSTHFFLLRLRCYCYCMEMAHVSLAGEREKTAEKIDINWCVPSALSACLRDDRYSYGHIYPSISISHHNSTMDGR